MTTPEHACSGYIYHKGCTGCAVRLLLQTKKCPNTEAAMLFYLTRYHGHSEDELIIDLEIARSAGPRTSA
jgi:hypothetical protein